MEITFNPDKRDTTLAERGIDFADVVEVFSGRTLDRTDKRHDYGEERIVTVGHLLGRMLVVVWTPRSGARHIISMRKANKREQMRYGQQLGKN